MLLRKLLFFIFVAGSLIFLFISLWPDFGVVDKLSFKINLNQVVLIIVTSVLIHLLNVFSWHLILLSTGIRLSFIKNMQIWIMSGLSRFIPGSVWQFISRGYLVKEESGVSVVNSASAVILEVLFNIITGILMVSITIFFTGDLIKVPLIFKQLVIVVNIGLGIFFILKDRLLIFVTRIINKVSNKGININKIVFDKKYLIPITTVYMLQYILSGCLLLLITKTFIDLPYDFLPVFWGVFAYSWLLGYISFFAPGGIGVQEFSITGILSTFMPFYTAGVVAVIFRIVLVSTEVCIFLIVLFTQSIRKNSVFLKDENKTG